MNDPWLALVLGLLAGIALGVVYYLLRLQPQIKQESRKAAELQRQIDKTNIEQDQLKQNLDDRTEQLRVNTEELVSLRDQLSNSRSDISSLEADLNNAKEAVEERNSQINKHELEKETLNNQLQKANNDVTRLTSELENSENNAKFLDRAKTQLGDTFAALASKALDDNTRKFLDNAQAKAEQSQKAVSDLVKPLQDTLHKLENQTENLAKERRDNQSRLEQEIKSLLEFSGKAQEEVRKLSRAFSQSQVRGQWGEYVLEQILKFSGLQENTHYDKQVTLQTADGKQRARPDYIIKLPNGRKLVIDAKTSFQAFEEAAMAEDENKRNLLLMKHAEQVRENLDRLAKTDYLPFIQETYGEIASPEYVIMFLPSEALYQAALEQLPKLAQEGFQKRVILTSPTTLFALMGIIHLGFRENALAAEAAEIGNRGKELYKRTSTLVEHISKIGGGIQNAVNSYNSAVGSLKRRFIPEAEKFGKMESIRGEEFPELQPVSDSLRHDDMNQAKLLIAPMDHNNEGEVDEAAPY